MHDGEQSTGLLCELLSKPQVRMWQLQPAIVQNVGRCGDLLAFFSHGCLSDLSLSWHNNLRVAPQDAEEAKASTVSLSAAESMFGELVERQVSNSAPYLMAKKLGFPADIFESCESAETWTADLDIRALGAQVRFFDPLKLLLASGLVCTTALDCPGSPNPNSTQWVLFLQRDAYIHNQHYYR